MRNVKIWAHEAEKTPASSFRSTAPGSEATARADAAAALDPMLPPLRSIAIAGAWGYIGRKVLDAALRRGLRVSVYDPGPFPADLNPQAVTRLASESSFYDLDVDLFHLALHPEARHTAQSRLLQRAESKPLFILNEKPIVLPESSQDALPLLEAVDRSRAVMLYDFPELFDPLTHRITEYLSRFTQVEISSIAVERSKDREDPAIPRNYKRMLPIQFQESVHCLAYVLYVLAALRGSFEAVLAEGVSVSANSEPYLPPNPGTYPYVVDGRCEFRLSLGPLAVEGITNFKRGASWAKRRLLRGHGDGQPFVIEADYLEGRKYLRINGADQDWDAAASSYEAILSTLAHWRATVPAATLLRGVYPNPRLAWLAFQLSGALWRSSRERRRIDIADLRALNGFDSGFRAARENLPPYAVQAKNAGRDDHGG
jgi:predicted dehydrogenase